MQLETNQATEILYPVAFEEALADIPIFASDATEINDAIQRAQKDRAAQIDADALEQAKKSKLPQEYFSAKTVAKKLKILRGYEKQRLRHQAKKGSPQDTANQSRAAAAALPSGRADLTDSTASLASLSGRPLTSQELHESLLTSTLARQGFPSEAQAVLDHVMLLRAKERYLFNCALNQEIVSDDPWLRDVWGWVGGKKLRQSCHLKFYQQLLTKYLRRGGSSYEWRHVGALSRLVLYGRRRHLARGPGHEQRVADLWCGPDGNAVVPQFLQLAAHNQLHLQEARRAALRGRRYKEASSPPAMSRNLRLGPAPCKQQQ